MMKEKIVFIVGPTGIGKTRLSVKLAGRIRGEIISCDSMQIYKGMRILSQAPAKSEMKDIRHHLIAVLDSGKEYNVAIFAEKAAGIIKSIIARGHVPIITGGSGLYVKALVDGLFPSPGADLKFRDDMADLVSRYGTKKLHKKLSGIDPASAEKIDPKDARRIIRALELYHLTGRTMTDLKSETRGLKDAYAIKLFGLIKPREDIYSDINTRVDTMFRAGVVQEVKRLKKRRLSKTAKAALGFKEITGYLKGEYGLEEAKEMLKRNTRRFAKRQLTWFRADSRIRWFDAGKLNDERIIGTIAKAAR